MLGTHDELDKICLLNIDGEYLAILINANHAVGGHVANRAEYELVSNSLAVNKCTFRCLIHEEIAHLCNDKDHTIFG